RGYSTPTTASWSTVRGGEASSASVSPAIFPRRRSPSLSSRCSRNRGLWNSSRRKSDGLSQRGRLRAANEGARRRANPPAYRRGDHGQARPAFAFAIDCMHDTCCRGLILPDEISSVGQRRRTGTFKTGQQRQRRVARERDRPSAWLGIG